VAKPSSRKIVGALLCLAAVAMVAAGCVWARESGGTSTDNAYIRGDVTSLAPKIAGYVMEVDVEDNQAVRAGDILFRIDDKDYSAHLAEAVANIQAAEARLANVDAEIQLQHALVRQAMAQKRATESEMKRAIKASDRRRKLVVTGAVGQEAVDDSDAARSSGAAAVAAAAAAVDAQEQRIGVLAAERKAASAALAQAVAKRDLAQLDLDSTVVRAPVDGVVGNRQVRVGRYVTPGTSLLDIVPVNDLWLVANFKETQVEAIQPGQRATITIDGYSSTPLEGVVDSFAPGSGSAFSLLPADNATGNFVRVVQRVPVKILFVNNPLAGRLVPGLSARVEIAAAGEK
jgi:membrane fusion protein, multidrug efflux system